MDAHEINYAQTVVRVARIASDECDTQEQCIDLLCDATALLISECSTTLEQAIERLKESAPVFEDAEEMVRAGGLQ